MAICLDLAKVINNYLIKKNHFKSTMFLLGLPAIYIMIWTDIFENLAYPTCFNDLIVFFHDLLDFRLRARKPVERSLEISEQIFRRT